MTMLYVEDTIYLRSQIATSNTENASSKYTVRRTRLAGQDIANFNSQYPTLTVNYTGAFHDRFLIIDEETAYHIGASLKDAGKKCFGISRIEDVGIISDILQRLEIETEEANN